MFQYANESYAMKLLIYLSTSLFFFFLLAVATENHDKEENNGGLVSFKQ